MALAHDWSKIPPEPLHALLSRQVIHTARMTIARITLRKSAVVPMHHHSNEQVSVIEKGALRWVIGGEEFVVRTGAILEIPPDVPHSVEALEDSVAVDIFSPVREDWVRGDDAYLRR